MRKLFLSMVFGVLASGIVCAQESEEKLYHNDFHKWQVRLRGILVTPDESANIGLIGGDAAISKSFMPELDFTYYFTKNIAAELILGTTNHDVKAINTAVGNLDLGDVWLLPPTLTLQYHWNVEENVRPYVGAGFNYTIFYNAANGPIADNVDYENSFSPAMQFGIDFDISKRWFINIDAKYLFLSTDVEVDATSALGAVVNAEVDINPFIAGIGIGFKL
ncbi:outer membrane protein W [Galbibacter orientalis DSM 19592]|uniref:Outer membrane protein W n=1 Tax=Galbibacter orientalis DSM 19592 TaxID=926559 RepID=I3C455_9FLAO|nr:OmpW family outer membrane protein [Galbibacter orientalis]EIJ38398.1 outer membrane protein W [Galbibacter orientalis DSM 19592]